MKVTRRGLFGLVGGAAAAGLLPFTPKEIEAVEEVIPRFQIHPCSRGPFKSGDVVRNQKTSETFLVRHAEAARETVHRELWGDPKNKKWPFHKFVTKPEEPGHVPYRKRTKPPALVIVPFYTLSVGDTVTFTAMPLDKYKDRKYLWKVGAAHEEAVSFPEWRTDPDLAKP